MDFDFLSSALQIAYPFVSDIAVTRHGASTQLTPLVASARIRTTDQREEQLTVNDIYIKSDDNWATVAAADLELEWGTSGGIMMLSLSGGTAQFRYQIYGNWLAVEWYGAPDVPTSSSSSESSSSSAQPLVYDVAAKFIFPISAIETDGASQYVEIRKLADLLVLEPSVVIQGPDKLRRVYWKHGNTVELIADRGEEFIIRAGFNMNIAQAVEAAEGFVAEDFAIVAGRPLTKIAIDAVPGAGQGKYLLCTGSQYLLTLNGVSADARGNVNINPLSCYWLERALDGDTLPATLHELEHTGNLAANELKIHNACGPCCSCDDYIAAYNHMKEIWDRAKVVAAELYAIRDKYVALSALYNSATGADLAMLTLTVTDDGYMKVMIALRNDDPAHIEWNTVAADMLQYTLTFTLPGGVTATFLAGSGIEADSFGKHVLTPVISGVSYTLSPVLGIAYNTIHFWVGLWQVTGAAGLDIEASVITSGGSLPDVESGSADVTFPGP